MHRRWVCRPVQVIVAAEINAHVRTSVMRREMSSTCLDHIGRSRIKSVHLRPPRGASRDVAHNGWVPGPAHLIKANGINGHMEKLGWTEFGLSEDVGLWLWQWMDGMYRIYTRRTSKEPKGGLPFEVYK